MIAFRIISTVLLGISVLAAIGRHVALYDEESTVVGAICWSMIWRAFVIVSLWII